MNATFGPENALPGSMSFMSQSGAFITAVLDWANDEGLGFKDVVSLGNKAVLDETDFVRAWGEDPDTDVILGYLEGVEDGATFIDTAREVTGDTPIVMVKSGRTDAGAQAVSSHTGTLAGSDRAYEAGLEQAGVLRVDSVQELFDFAQILAGQPLPDRDDVAIVTNAGGPGVMTTDAVGDSTLSLASFSEETLSELAEALPEEANIYNPIDAIGDADIARFRDAIDIALADENVGTAVVLAAPTAVIDYGDLAEVIVELQAKHGKPVAAAMMGGERTAGGGGPPPRGRDSELLRPGPRGAESGRAHDVPRHQPARVRGTDRVRRRQGACSGNPLPCEGARRQPPRCGGDGPALGLRDSDAGKRHRRHARGRRRRRTGHRRERRHENRQSRTSCTSPTSAASKSASKTRTCTTRTRTS